jgi:hypothetical protein
MKKSGIYFLIVLLSIAASCKKESQPAEENDNELITTIELEFTERETDSVTTFRWDDPDGAGGDVPEVDSILLEENKVYDVKVTLWNKAVTPAENITDEVKGESENHRFYYEVSAGSGITVGGLDNDINGLPLGVASEWTTTAAGSGTLTLVLRHYGSGGKEPSDPVNSPKSSTDAGAIFTLKVGS